MNCAAASSRGPLPYRPSGEYDFRVRFTRNSGVHSIALMFVAGDGQATFEIDAWGEHLAASSRLAAATWVSERHASPIRATNGREYTARVE
ncbi:MAG: hypothetical protein R3C99_26980 [Pirellulaceae bacterium]